MRWEKAAIVMATPAPNWGLSVATPLFIKRGESEKQRVAATARSTPPGYLSKAYPRTADEIDPTKDHGYTTATFSWKGSEAKNMAKTTERIGAVPAMGVAREAPISLMLVLYRTLPKKTPEK